MDKIFTIATEITNPYSLTALFFLILFVLYRAILSKVGEQKGTKGFLIIKRLMSLVAVIAILTLLLVFGLQGYKVYSKVEDTPKIESLERQISESTNTIVGTLQYDISSSSDFVIDSLNKQITASSERLSSAIIDAEYDAADKVIEELKAPELAVEYSLMKYEDAKILIGNNGDKIIIVKNLTIFWEYEECPFYKEPLAGAYMVPYRYHVEISKSNDSKIIEPNEFKYGKGDIDKFNVAIEYPGLGIYRIWFTFDYKIFGTKEWFRYETGEGIREICEKF